jgi:hypothetical protein
MWSHAAHMAGWSGLREVFPFAGMPLEAVTYFECWRSSTHGGSLVSSSL